MDTKQPYKFLQNIPVGEDLFEGKSQEKIASVITENIKNKDFQIIGIDGAWGTGKSNVVKIIENKLPEKDYQFFVYDVWGHQEDDQRKAILVELTDFIKEKELVKDVNKWNNKLTRLLAREREVTTKNYPYLSIGFIFSLVSIIYIPAINVFKDSLTNYFEIEKVYWKILLVLFPVIILFGIYIWNLIKCWKKKMGFCKSFKLSAQETFLIYNDKQTQETKIETISENEPSVRDFRNWMKEIDIDLQNHKNNLIIVFDNFDRLPKQHIQNIWSSIHIFFSEDKYKNIKVIIPFDRAHIKNSFSELNHRDKQEDISKVDFANDYINKTFDIVFRISPPIMSAWKQFFRICWEKSFGKISDEKEYSRVEQIYETYSKLITPREIIAFINEIISIKLIYRNIPESYISLFVINKDEILKDPLKAITEAIFLKGLEYLYKDTDDFQKYITALAYQIDPDNALEVIYKKQLKSSLLNQDTEKLKEISKTNVFSLIIRSTLLELEDYIKPTLTLNTLDEKANISDELKQLLWDDIYLKLNLNGKDIVLILDSVKILLINISVQYKKKFIQKIIDALLWNNIEFTPNTYTKIIDELNLTCSNASIDINIFELLHDKQIQPKEFLSFLKNKKEDFFQYKISVNNDELENYLSQLNVEILEEVIGINYLLGHYTFNSFEEAIKNKIAIEKDNSINLAILLKFWKIVSSKPLDSETLIDNNTLFKLYNQHTSEQDLYFDLIAMIISRWESFPANYKSVLNSIVNQENVELESKVSDIIEYYIQYGSLLLQSIAFPNELTKALVRNTTINQHPNQHANTTKLIMSFDKICTINQLDPQKFIDNLNRWKTPDINKSFIEEASVFYFEEAAKSNTELGKKSILALKKYFDDKSKDEWKVVLRDLTGDIYKLTEIIQYNSWNSYSREALNDILIELIRSNDISNLTNMNSLLIRFEKSNIDLSNTFKNIRDELISQRNINSQMFSILGGWMFKYASLEEKTGDVFRTILISELFDNDDCLKIITNNKEKVLLLINKAKDNEISDFTTAIKDRTKNENIQKLAIEFGFISTNDEKKEEKK